MSPFSARHDWTQLFADIDRLLARETVAGDEGLNTPMLAVVETQAGDLLILRPGKGIMAPFSANGFGIAQKFAAGGISKTCATVMNAVSKWH